MAMVVQPLYCEAFRYIRVFFFQAEDGIRDLVRSRGLGDVYKRQLLDSIPFSSDIMYSASLVEDHKGKKEIIAKGAPDKILDLCSHCYSDGKILPLDSSLRKDIHEALVSRSSKGFRLIGFFKRDDVSDTSLSHDAVKSSVFLGAAAIYDPPKDEVKQVIAEAKGAGINLVMITGDSK